MSKFLILERFLELTKRSRTQRFTLAVSAIRELTPIDDGTIVETMDGKMYCVTSSFDELNTQLDATHTRALS